MVCLKLRYIWRGDSAAFVRRLRGQSLCRSSTVAYLFIGFRRGGGKFSLATSAHTKEGANQVFQFFFNVKIFFGQINGGHGPMALPPKYA